MKKTLSQEIGDFVKGLSYDELPREVIEKAKCCMINALAIGVSSHPVRFCIMARELIKAEELGFPSDKGATLFCDGAKVTPMGAAFANAVLLHGRVQEDTMGSSHAGTIVVPSVLALAERDGYPGKKILEAIVAGYEIVGRLDKSVSMDTTPRGFRASPIFGIFGSSIASSKLLGLSKEQIVNAIGFAAAFAGGTLESFAAGTVEWRYEVGIASRDGMTAALLARQGAPSSRTAMEGKAGFLDAFAGNTKAAPSIAGDLGKTWSIMGAGFKPYPVCAFNQTPVRTFLALVQEHTLSCDDMEKIEVRVNPYEYHYAGLASQGPFGSAEAALMSTPFCIALATKEETVTLGGLNKFQDPQIMEVMKRVEHHPDERLPGYCCIVTITKKDGKTFSKESREGADYYNFDMEKTIALARQVTSEVGISRDKVERMIDLIKNLEQAPHIKPLTEILGACP